MKSVSISPSYVSTKKQLSVIENSTLHPYFRWTTCIGSKYIGWKFGT